MELIEIVEVLPLGQPLLQIDITLVAQELIELLLIRAMRALDLPVQLWGAGFAVDVLDAFVREVSMKQSLDLMAAVGAHCEHAEGTLRDHIVCLPSWGSRMSNEVWNLYTPARSCPAYDTP